MGFFGRVYHGVHMAVFGWQLIESGLLCGPGGSRFPSPGSTSSLQEQDPSTLPANPGSQLTGPGRKVSWVADVFSPRRQRQLSLSPANQEQESGSEKGNTGPEQSAVPALHRSHLQQHQVINHLSTPACPPISKPRLLLVLGLSSSSSCSYFLPLSPPRSPASPHRACMRGPPWRRSTTAATPSATPARGSPRGAPSPSPASPIPVCAPRPALSLGFRCLFCVPCFERWVATLTVR